MCNYVAPFMEILVIVGDHTISNKTKVFYYAVFPLKAGVCCCIVIL